MAYNFKSQEELIKSVIPSVYDKIYEHIGDVEVEIFRTEEPVPFEDRMMGERLTFKKGDVWGKLWDCAWIHFKGIVPENAEGEKIVLNLDIHGEMGIYDQNGEIIQGLTSGSCMNVRYDEGCFGIRKREYVVTECAKGGEKIDIWADAGCNYLVGEDKVRPDLGKIEMLDICICRDNIKELFYDFLVLYDLMTILPEDSARFHRIRQSLFEASCELFDYSDEEIEKASEILKKELDKKGGDADLKITALGHSHIDLAWLWPIRETKRKAIRTFSNVMYFMGKYPNYLFGASQSVLYEWVKEQQPKLYEKVKQKIKEGKWEVQGGMYCEPDTNVTGGESLIRQILYGKRFFNKEFGQNMKILWLPDVFGYSVVLPQILKKCGMPYFMTTKLGWGNRHNEHPYNTFIWKGLDGSEVLTHMPPEGDYNSFALPSRVHKIENKFKDKCISDEALMLYGIGDGGGGPGELQLEALKRTKNLAGMPPVKQEFAESFFERLSKNQNKYHTYSGELYFEMHQGTYTTQGRNKWYNRKMEKALREAEFAFAATGKEYPKEKLEKIWKEVLLYQFHDILPGSSIKRVYDESLARYEVIYDETNTLIENTYGDGDYAINSLSWDRKGWEKIDGKWYNLNVPAMGSVKLERGIDSKETKAENTNILENDAVKVTFDKDGAILRVFDKANNKEALKEKSNRLAVYVDNGDGWDFSESYRQRKPKYFELVNAEAFADGPQKGIKQEYVFGESRLWQTVSIKEGSPIVEFDTKVDWKEREKMLRTAFYTAIETNEVSCDIQFGTIKRTNNNNTSIDMARFEVCAHKYADLSDNNYGVALMNDSKYGYCAERNVLDLNLLRSPNYPDETADCAVHTFKYALYPHTGNLEQSDVLMKSYEFNQPIFKGGKIEQLLTVSNPDIVVESVKGAEDSDAIIVRMYESKGGECETALKFGRAVKSAYITNMLEENQEKANLDKIKFHGFEIITVKVEVDNTEN